MWTQYPVVPSAGGDEKTKRQKNAAESDSSTGEEERTQKLLGKNSLLPEDSPATEFETRADHLDGTQLAYEVEAEDRALDVARVATGKNEALHTSTVLKPCALLELSWAQLRHLERSRHGRLVKTQLASLVSHSPAALHSAVFDTTRVRLKSTEAHQQSIISDTSKCNFVSCAESEERIMHVLKQSCQRDPATAVK